MMAFVYSSVLLVVIVSLLGGSLGCDVANDPDNCFLGTKARETSSRKTENAASSEKSGQGRLFEAQIETLLRAVLEKGIPELGLPQLDPFVYEDNLTIGEIGLPGIMAVEYLELGDFRITGLSSFIVNALYFNILGLTVSFNFTFPIEVQANHIDFRIIVGDLIPFYGNQTANLISDLRLEGAITIGSSSEQYLYVRALTADIHFETLMIDISNLMGVGGGKQGHIFNNLIGEVTPELIDMMKPLMWDGIIESLLVIINDAILPLKLTVQNFLDCIQGASGCPFALP